MINIGKEEKFLRTSSSITSEKQHCDVTRNILYIYVFVEEIRTEYNIRKSCETFLNQTGVCARK
jgi:hypothetical protein